MARYETWSEKRGAEIIEQHAHQAGAALPILHALQATFGYVHADAVKMVASTLNLSRAEMHGVVTFYHDFRSAPAGDHVLKLCRAEACQSMGADALAAHVREKLRVDWHGTTTDKRVTLEPVFCLGLCACAPAAMMDNQVHGRLDAKRLDTLIDGARRS
ncbi:MAG TPA: formate dehydrogenase subunit gamma [Stellaceae bacterium]|nr:formate dehydrogenase subunit gamma [Stellaceae bacterium]